MFYDGSAFYNFRERGSEDLVVDVMFSRIFLYIETERDNMDDIRIIKNIKKCIRFTVYFN